MGSSIWKNFTAGNDARVVHNLKEAGAISGKTVTAEFAVHKLNETLNPHDKNLHLYLFKDHGIRHEFVQLR